MSCLFRRFLTMLAGLLVAAHAHAFEAGWMQIQTAGATPDAPTTTVALYYPTMAAPRAARRRHGTVLSQCCHRRQTCRQGQGADPAQSRHRRQRARAQRLGASPRPQRLPGRRRVRGALDGRPRRPHSAARSGEPGVVAAPRARRVQAERARSREERWCAGESRVLYRPFCGAQRRRWRCGSSTCASRREGVARVCGLASVAWTRGPRGWRCAATRRERRCDAAGTLYPPPSPAVRSGAGATRGSATPARPRAGCSRARPARTSRRGARASWRAGEGCAGTTGTRRELANKCFSREPCEWLLLCVRCF